MQGICYEHVWCWVGSRARCDGWRLKEKAAESSSAALSDFDIVQHLWTEFITPATHLCVWEPISKRAAVQGRNDTNLNMYQPNKTCLCQMSCQKWKCQQELVLVFCRVHFYLSMSSAEAWLWLIVKGFSVLPGTTTTDFTCRPPIIAQKECVKHFNLQETDRSDL